MDRPAESHRLVAGVCSRIALFFHCNAWLLRAGFIVLLLVKTLWALAVYVGLALLFRFTTQYRGNIGSAKKNFLLKSPQFAARNERIRALDQRFREWEDSRTDQ